MGTVYPPTIKAVFVAPETNKHKSRVKWTKWNILKQIAIQRLACEQALHSGDIVNAARFARPNRIACLKTVYLKQVCWVWKQRSWSRIHVASHEYSSTNGSGLGGSQILYPINLSRILLHVLVKSWILEKPLSSINLFITSWCYKNCPSSETLSSSEPAVRTFKAIPIKWFVSHRPVSCDAASVGRAKKKEWTNEGVDWVSEKAGLLSKRAWLQSQLVNMVFSTLNCLNSL